MTTSAPTNATLHPLTETDFDTVAALGGTIWRAHYSKIISMAQIDYMLAGRYVPDNLRKYLDADDRWMHILRLAGRPVGYCSHALTTTPGEMKLEQLYLLPELHGQGLGGFMLRHVEADARRRGCTTLVLTVNIHNAASIAVYRKSGFTVREAAKFDIGNGFVMDDYVMVKALAGIAKPMIRIRDIDHIVLRVVDLDAMLRFYCHVLGCTIERRQDEIGLIQLRAGRSLVDLVPIDGKLGSMGGAAPGKEGRNLDHFCFRIEPFDELAIRDHLLAHGVDAAPLASRFGAEGEGPSIYITDPEGNTVELKGPPTA